MKKEILLLSAIALSGCATTVVPPSQAIPAPHDRVFKYQNKSDADGTLTIVRDKGFTGGGCFATVYINGDRVAKLDTKEKATLYLPVGEIAVGANLEGSGLCGFSGARQERYITLTKGESKSVRIFTDSDGNMDIRPTTIN